LTCYAQFVKHTTYRQISSRRNVRVNRFFIYSSNKHSSRNCW